MLAYKLCRKRKDGTLGPLFINRKQVLPVGKWLEAEEHKTKGYAFRPGWHTLALPVAPHLKKSSERVWVKVRIKDWKEFERPFNQGGKWFLAKKMMVIEELIPKD